MLLLTTVLVLLVAFVLGLARKPWWQVGPLAAIACGPTHVAPLWLDDWRYRVGLSSQEQMIDMQALFLILGWFLLCTYLGYALGFLSSRWWRVSG
jgi:hypothetical protein